jgi:polysaccharide export outer membrane protein
MNASHLLSEAAICLLADTLIKFVWQGTLVGAIAWAVLFVAAPRSARARYAVHATAMLAFLAWPAFTLLSGAPYFEHAGLPGPRTELKSGVSANSWVELSASGGEISAAAAMGEERTVSLMGELYGWLQQRRGHLVALWLVGAALGCARLLLGAVGIWRLKRTREPLPPQVAETIERLMQAMAFRVRPAVYCSQRVTQAVALGIFRPMVLLPASWALDLEPAMLEAVLAHELAHLRRWDLPLNLLQRLVEAVFFFHPAVWWCSRRMRLEREICCDELALAATGKRKKYAEALTFLAALSVRREPALAAGIGGSKMSLLERVRHVLGMSRRTQSPLYGPVCALVGACAASLAWALVLYATPEGAQVARVQAPETGQQANVQRPPMVPSGTSYGWKSNETTPDSAGRRPWQSGQSVDVSAKGIVVPSEKNMVTLATYTIEPPDILFIEALRVIPKVPPQIRSTDVLSVQLVGGFPAAPSGGGPKGDQYQVSPGGRIDLGPVYGDAGRVKVAGLTEDEAAAAITASLRQVLKNPQVSVQFVQQSGMQPISGEHLVAPDGTVNLGTYGRVYVAGLTLEEARAAVEKHLSEVLDDPIVSLQVYAYNSKVYYVVTEGAGLGDTVSRFPVTGNETVLDALSQVGGLKLQGKQIWISRPEPNGGDAILPVNWKQISSGGATANNYQILPGDRVFVSAGGQSGAAAGKVGGTAAPRM